MAFTPKVLGQGAPAGANVNLYTVPSSTNAVVSSIAICNVTGSAATATIYVRIAGATAAVGNAIMYATSIAANSTTFLTVGATLATTDIITVASGTSGALTFTAFGSELT